MKSLSLHKIDLMFTIGMFSTCMPVMLIALIYGASLGMHSVMNIQPEPNLPVDRSKQIELSETCFQLSLQSERSTYYYGQDAQTAEISADPIPDERKPRFGHLPDIIPVKRQIVYSRFCRPPPLA